MPPMRDQVTATTRHGAAASRALQPTATRVHYAATEGDLGLFFSSILRERRGEEICNIVFLISAFSGERMLFFFYSLISID